MLLSYIAGIFAVCLWAILPALVKASLQEIPISVFLIYRFTISAALFAVFLPGLFKKVRKISGGLLLLLAFVLTATFAVQSLALKNLPASVYVVVFSINPLLTSILVGIRFSRLTILGFGLALGGVVAFVLSYGLSSLQASSIESWTFLFVGMLLWVFYSTLAKKLQNNLNDFEVMNLTNFLSFLGALIIWVSSGVQTIGLQQLSNTSIVAIALTSLGVPMAYYAYLFSMRRTLLFSQMSQYLEMVFGLLFAALILHEKVNFGGLLASAAILSSLFISHYATSVQQKSEEVF